MIESSSSASLAAVQKMSGYLINFNWEIRGARRPENQADRSWWMDAFRNRRFVCSSGAWASPARVMNEYVLLFIEWCQAQAQSRRPRGSPRAGFRKIAAAKED